MPAKKEVEVEKVSSEPLTKSVVKKESVVREFIAELTQKPELAVELIQTLSNITKPWEAIGSNGAAEGSNEVPVPPGKSAKAFQKQNVSGPYISGYKLTTIFGDDVALIVKDTPKWRITILGETQIDGPFVEHGKKAEQNAKDFVEERLRLRGYVIGS